MLLRCPLQSRTADIDHFLTVSRRCLGVARGGRREEEQEEGPDEQEEEQRRESFSKMWPREGAAQAPCCSSDPAAQDSEQHLIL